MKYEIELNNTYANLEFDVNILDSDINIHVLLQTSEADTLFMSVYINDEQIGQAFNCCPNQFVIPYKYMVEKVGGNFVFETVSDEYPSFKNFGDTCKLYFITMDEIYAE